MAGASCGSELPDSPTWAADVRPILLARCGRCHGDSPWTEDPRKLPPTNVFTSVEEPEGLADFFEPVLGRIRSPPPAEPLEDWQIEILERWSRSPPP
jgi:hypothetical protein